ncbi:MAG: hypothetical protein ACJ8KU_01755 [Chthoniobacterales bacterium]
MKRLFATVALLCALCFSIHAQEEVDQEHQREEVGVNPYTAPDVDEVFKQLEDVKPLPFDQLKRDFPQTFPAAREQLGLIFGSLIADGFLIVECEHKERVEELGRVLLRQAKALGVGERVIRHSASLTELGKRGDWGPMRRELTQTQDDVEKNMIELKDEKLAHLVSLGGWLRGLEISAGAVDLDYSPDRTRGLWQRDLIHYYAEELKTLPPNVAHDALFEKLRAGIDAIRDILDKAPPDNISREEVKTLHQQAHDLNLAIAGSG